MPITLNHAGDIAVTNGTITVDGNPVGGLSGTNYIYVAAAGTDTQNATELQAAYDAAKLLSPTATNRITIVAGPGYYNFGSTTFTMDTEYIDLVSLDGNKSVLFNSSNAAGTISVAGNNVFVKGVDVGTKRFIADDEFISNSIFENCKGGEGSFGTWWTAPSAPTTTGTFINCIGGNGSFGGYGATSTGTYTNCIGGEGSFGGNGGVSSGTYTNCTAGQDSFGNNGLASGIFTDCVGGQGSFGGNNATASGTFTNCTSGNYSFGGGNGIDGIASGTFTNCTSGNYSFGGGGGNNGLSSGIFTRCRAGNYSFGRRGYASGIFSYCTAGDESFGGYPSGTFIGCKASSYSFGPAYYDVTGYFVDCICDVEGGFGYGTQTNISGTFINCHAKNYSFGPSSIVSGVFKDCTAGDEAFGSYYGFASGTFNNCVGGSSAFGKNGTLSGKLYYCRLTSGTFETVSGSGVTRYCIDGTNATNNQG